MDSSEWIPDLKAMPDEATFVLAFTDGGVICVATVLADEWMECSSDGDFDVICGNVTHWMPLPAPPTEETK